MKNSSHDFSQLSPVKQQLLQKMLQERQARRLVPSAQVIQHREEQEDIPLSFAQQRLWFLEQLGASRSPYNMLSAHRLNGPLDVQVLEECVQEIVQRHAVFRTIFVNRNGHPVQIIRPTLNIIMPIIDLTLLSASEQEREMLRLTRSEEQQLFNLAQGPLLHVTLLRLKEDEYIFLISSHHIITDGWSLGIFIGELNKFYIAFRGHRNKPDGWSHLQADLLVQYADFARWQREWLQGEILQKQLDYWRLQLAGAPALLELPTDRPRPAVRTFAGARLSRLLSPELLQQLKSLSRQEYVTLFMTLLATFQVLLMRYSGQSDIVVSTPIVNRTQRELEGLIGLFVNTLVLRIDLSSNPTFQQLLGQVQEMVVQAYAHQDTPFEKLVEELQPERNLSYQPLSQVDFNLLNFPIPRLELPDVFWRPIEVEQSTSQFDLSLFLREVGSGLAPGLMARLEYNTDLFDAATMERLLGHWQTLLEAIVQNPGQLVQALPLLTMQERDQLVVQWNATVKDLPHELCLHQLIELQVEQTPETIAVVFEETSLTYRELNSQANHLAHRLLREEIGPDVLVGVCMERSLELVITLLAVLKAGGAYVPLDPQLPQERLTFLLEDAQVPVVLTQTHLRNRLPPTIAKTICLASDISPSHLEHTENPKPRVQPENLAYMIYTSGSTGKPKGTMNTHRGICNRLLWMQDTYQLTPRDRVLQKTPFSFDVSVWEFFWPLLTGARLIMARPGGHQDPTYLRTLIVQQQVTTLHFVPSMLQAFLSGSPNLENCTSLRQVICSGEALSPELQTSFFAHVAEDVTLHNLYGPTEAAIDVTFWQCQRDRGGDPLRSPEDYRVPIGRPIANTQIYLLDKNLEPVPIGVTGELYIGGVGLARGYWKRPELTAERFIANPFVGTGRGQAPSLQPPVQEGGERLYHTGDLARYRADGAIEFLGRIDHQVKIRGFRIELGEIEACLVRHPALQECVVLVTEPVSGDKRLIAYLVSTRQPEPSVSELRRLLEEQLPEYMIPTAFIYLDALPLTPNGKLDRQALPALDQQRPQLEAQYIAPLTEAERTITQIWQTVLHIDQVGIADNFFELGGNSLLMVEVHHRLCAAFQRDISLISLLRYPTIKSLVEFIGQEHTQSGASQEGQVRASNRIARLQHRQRYKRAQLPVGDSDADA